MPVILRKPAWPELFANFLEALQDSKGLSFDTTEASKIDCVRLANAHVENITGFNFLKHYALEYADKRSAVRAAAKCHKHFEMHFWELPGMHFSKIPAVFANAGDLVIYDERQEAEVNDLDRHIFGIYDGHKVLVITSTGIGYKPLLDDNLKCVYKVG